MVLLQVKHYYRTIHITVAINTDIRGRQSDSEGDKAGTACFCLWVLMNHPHKLCRVHSHPSPVSIGAVTTAGEWMPVPHGEGRRATKELAGSLSG